jgi:hypothetical protein
MFAIKSNRRRGSSIIWNETPQYNVIRENH